MKVILKEDIRKLGNRFDVVEVKKGYARNYLLPRSLAILASRDNIKKIEKQKKTQISLKNIEKQHAQELADKLSNFSCNVKVESTPQETIYGSVTDEDISRAIEEEGYKIDKDKIILSEPIKKLGIYEVGIILHPEVTAKIKVWVVKK